MDALAQLLHRASWRTEAACAGRDPGLWFPIGEDSSDPVPVERVAVAKAICRGCPVRGRCLVEHLHEPYGVFGGLTAVERRRLRRPPRRRS